MFLTGKNPKTKLSLKGGDWWNTNFDQNSAEPLFGLWNSAVIHYLCYYVIHVFEIFQWKPTII